MIDPNGIYYSTASILKFQPLLFEDSLKMVIISSLQYLVHHKRMELFAFVIMPNHIHFIWSEGDNHSKESCKTSFLKFTASEFKKYLKQFDNKELRNFLVDKSDRKYQFWQRNSLDIEILSTNMFDQKLDYIHENPLQKKWQLTDYPTKYKYSSAKFYEEGIDEFGILSSYYHI